MHYLINRRREEAYRNLHPFVSDPCPTFIRSSLINCGGLVTWKVEVFNFVVYALRGLEFEKSSSPSRIIY
jgi:hypothetical protein